MDISSIPARWRAAYPYLLSVLRILAAFLTIQFGTAKWFAFPAAILPDGGTVALVSQLGLAAILETIGGSLLLLGLFTRPVAFLLSGQMAVAYFIGHAPTRCAPGANCRTKRILEWPIRRLHSTAASPCTIRFGSSPMAKAAR